VKLKEIANALGLTLEKDLEDISVTGVGPLDLAQPGEISFLSSSEYLKYVPSTRATVILTKTLLSDCPARQWVVKDPYLVFGRVSQLFWKVEPTFKGHSKEAFVEDGAVVHPSATLFPGCYVSRGAKIGERSVIYPFVFVGENVIIGEDTVIHANSVLEFGVKVGSRVRIFGNCTVGADGFGFAPSPQRMEKIPQMGTVSIEDDVEIGPGCTIDRATFGATKIGQGTKLDSQVHVGHNVELGRHNLICGKAGFAGSAKTEDFVVVGGNSNIGNLVTLHQGVRVGGGSTATKSIQEPGDYAGFPAEKIKEWRKTVVLTRRLEATEQRIKDLEEALRGVLGSKES
jgi:UDP-3-O-[3-hydroxymyristoyl] glucosamine N-acyltransferase